VARHFSSPTRVITLYPFGGVASLAAIPREPHKELWIALAGPAVNVALAAAALGLAFASGRLETVETAALRGGPFASRLFYLNVTMAAFNMLPAFPMDGGRVLRALMALRYDYVKATQIAASIAQALAVVLGIAGLFSNVFLTLIAVVVYLTAGQEARLTQAHAVMKGVPVRDAMVSRFVTLDAEDNIAHAAGVLLAGHQHDFPVVSRGQLVGMLPRAALLSAWSGGDATIPVRAAMIPLAEPVQDDASLSDVLDRMERARCSSLPVLRGGQLVGMISLESVGEWMMIHSRPARAKTPPWLERPA
jgi:CBS domain-containing protein